MIFAIFKFFTLIFQMKGFKTSLILFVLSSIQSIGIFFARIKLLIQQLFLREETFAVFLQNRKSCICIKYLTLVRPQKLIAMNFTFLYSIYNGQNSSIAKNYSFHNFLNRFICLFLFKKTFLPQKMFMSCLCLRHGIYLNGTSNQFVYLLIIFLGHDWFGFFLNEVALNSLRNGILALMTPFSSY